MKARGFGGGLLLGVLLAGLPAKAAARDSRLHVRPSLELAGGWDDNLLSTPEPAERDYVWRATPALEADHLGLRHRLRLRYAAEAEGFAEHPELDALPAGQRAESRLELTGRHWSAETEASYTETRRPEELNLTTGVSRERAEARRTELSQRLRRQLGALTQIGVEYGFRREELSGAVQGRRHVGRAELERRLSPRDELRFGYELRYFDFEAGAAETAHVVGLGWERRLGPRTALELEAGPRFSAGRVGPEGEALLRHEFERGELSFAYSRSQTTIIGDRGVALTDGVAARLSLRLTRRLSLSLAPGLLLTRRGATEARVVRTDADLVWQVTPYLALGGGHSFRDETGGLGRSAEGGVRRNSFLLRLAIGVPARAVREGEAEGASE